MITIESINGKQYTVVWYNGFTRHGSLQFNLFDGFAWNTAEGVPTSIALPALPRYPKPEDVRLLHLYAAHGLYPTFDIYQFAHMDDDGEVYGYGNAGLEMIADTEVTHATDSDGNRTNVAIEG